MEKQERNKRVFFFGLHSYEYLFLDKSKHISPKLIMYVHNKSKLVMYVHYKSKPIMYVHDKSKVVMYVHEKSTLMCVHNKPKNSSRTYSISPG